MTFPTMEKTLSVKNVETLAFYLHSAVALFFYDVWEFLRDAPFLLMGKHKIIYAEQAGHLPVPSHKRIAVVAIRPSREILPFTLNLLRGLAENGFFILCVSTSRLQGETKEQILSHSHHLIERYPIGRDFGSYKIALEWLEKRSFYAQAELLALINDSVFYTKDTGASIAELLKKGEASDWLGLYENFECRYHVQSYFQILRAPAFRSRAFINFWKQYLPFSSRRHSVKNGEAGFTRILKNAGFKPYILYNTVRIHDDVLKRLREKPAAEDKQFRYIVFLTANRVLKTWRDSLPSNKFEDSLTMEPEDLLRRVSVIMEFKNPTHAVGLLCNFLYGAGLKRDICYSGAHPIADIVSLSSGYSPEEMENMAVDLRLKGTAASSMSTGKILRIYGRI